MSRNIATFRRTNHPTTEAAMSVPTITPQRLEELHTAGKAVELIDVRTPVEYREAHVTFARNVPLDRLDPAALRGRTAPHEGPLYVICRSGSRGRQACERLAAAGLSAVNVEGGTLAWAEAGLPVVRGKKAISLERQVRIAAGSLVLLGAALGWLVHPAFVALSAFVGAGLVFAGLTDTCGMGLLLARMPWNHVSEPAATRCGAR
jgi:rhodanese-related sulfurtransferase